MMTGLLVILVLGFFLISAVVLTVGVKAFQSTMERLPALSELQRMADDELRGSPRSIEEAEARLKRFAYLIHQGI